MTAATDIDLLTQALALECITHDQRAAFTHMREALEQREYVALSPRQRLWVEGVVERGGGTTALAALGKIIANLESLGGKRT